mgnify:FL=1
MLHCIYFQSQHNMTLPAWVQWRNVTCNDNEQMPCEGKTVFEIMDGFRNLHYQMSADDKDIHKFYGGKCYSRGSRGQN